jgi:hypothetical protein
MSTKRYSILVAVSLCLAPLAGFAACSSDDANPAPVTPHGDGGPTNKPDGSLPGDKDAGPGDNDSGPAIDANLPDVGNCTSDASVCNSCYTPQQDPVNGCSPAAANCIPFTKTVPQAP